jgi:Fur family peroxide stress response transcriptional regulator
MTRPARKARKEKPALGELVRLCRERDLPLTELRRAILETVLSLDTHPTADEVLEAAARRHPGIGRATVYRALESFASVGILSKACHPGAAVRYDARRARHHHLICTRCERIVDVADEGFERLEMPDVSGLGFVVSDWQVQLRGICASCRKKENRE